MKENVNMSQLVKERFGWTCKGDEIIEATLMKQVNATITRQSYRKFGRLLQTFVKVHALEEEKIQPKGHSATPTDEHRTVENYRLLRVAKSDLQATQRCSRRSEGVRHQCWGGV